MAELGINQVLTLCEVGWPDLGYPARMEKVFDRGWHCKLNAS